MKDEDIIGLFWKRDETAISETSEKYGPYCRKIAENILFNPEDEEECLNDTWLCAWKTIPPKRPNRLSTYLGKITRNLALNLFRKKKTEKRGGGQTELVLSELSECVSSPENVETSVEERELVSAIEKFLWKQPEEKRNIFIRRYWHLCSINEIAKIYGISESKTASVLFRMRNELKNFLKKEGAAL